MTEKTRLSQKLLTDHDWLRQSFMISHGTQLTENGNPTNEDVTIRTRFFTTARFKFSDTTIGGNMVINPAPQFTRNADPRIKGLYKNSAGLGRYYSEAIDDNKRTITMCFGVAQFNSLQNFYRGFYDHNAATVARTGRAPSIFFTAGQAIGFVAGFLSPWLVLYSLGSAFVKTALNQPSSKYYFFKPSMATYWSAVTGVANDIAVKTQLISRKLDNVIGAPSRTTGDVRTSALSDGDLKDINKYIYQVIDSYDENTGEGNGINVYAVATRYPRIQRAAFKALEKYYASRSIPDDFATTIDGEGNMVMQQVSDAINSSSLRQPKQSFNDYLKNWSSGNAPGAMKGAGTDGDKISSSLDNSGNVTTSSPDAAGAPKGTPDLLTEKSIGDASDDDKNTWYNFLLAELDDGAQYVSFRVENNGDASESFSSQVGESEVSSKINSISGSARSTRFNLAEGEIVGGIAGKLVQGVTGAVKDMAMGAANSLGIDGVAALGGNAFADIPKYWLQSTADLPKMNYRIRLVSPYGNRYSKFVNIWLPVSMLLAGTLPLSAGPHAYTSPFLCQLFDRGRAQTRLGMIDSLQITRGLNNLAFNKIGEPMSVEVSFSVVELSNIIHMPIAKSFNPIGDASISAIFDNESLYHDYIATLTSLSLTEQIYVGERLKIGVTKYLKNLDSWFSVPHAMNALGDISAVRAFSAFFPGVANR